MKNKWIKLLNRPCFLAFQVEVATCNRNILPKIIGCQINNFWANSITHAVYYVEHDLKIMADIIAKRIQEDPDFTKHNISDCYKLGKQLLSKADILDFSQVSNKKLLIKLLSFREAYLNFFQYVVYPHSIERFFLNKIKEELAKNLKAINQENKLEESLKILTTPVILDSDQQLILLNTANLVRKNGWTKDIDDLTKKIHEKYTWMTLWDISAKPLSLQYFHDAIDAIASSHNTINIIKEIKQIKKQQNIQKNVLNKELREIKTTRLLRDYVNILQAYMFLRTYRKNIISKAHYLLLPFILEIGKRMRIGKDIFYISYEEMIDFLKNNKSFPESILSKRKKAWAVTCINGNIQIIAGKKEIQKAINKYGIGEKFTQTKITKVFSAIGNSACQGKISGHVKIVKNVDELYKIKQGDVIVTSMTTPDYMPIFRKLGGIVTDDGGITCHAAIISREFNIPCIVGTGNATQVFKDNDLVEVDAYKGKVKLLDRLPYSAL